MSKSTALRSARGFTLVELLVVIGISAVLVGLLMPALSRARAQANLTSCMSRERQLVQALSNYAALNRGKYPPNSASPSPGFYWNDVALLGIASDTPYSTDQPGLNVGTIFTCPRDQYSVRTYALNYWASSFTGLVGASAKLAAKRGMFWNIAARRGDRLLLVSETWSSTLVQTGVYKCLPTIGYAGDDPAARFGANGGVTPFNAGPWGFANCELAYELHRIPSVQGGTSLVGRVNVGFADGHVATCSCGDLVNQAGQLTGVAFWSPLDFWGQ